MKMENIISVLNIMNWRSEMCAEKNIWEKRENEVEHYGTRIVCWQQIVLGWLIKWRVGEGRIELLGGISGKGVIERLEREGKGRKLWRKEGQGREESPRFLRYLLKNADE
jgi:hypothetical protein